MIEERRRWCEADAVFNICNHKFVYYMRLHKCPCGGFSNRDMIQSEKNADVYEEIYERTIIAFN